MKKAKQRITSVESRLHNKIQKTLDNHTLMASQNLDWLYAHMHPYFFITMRDEVESLASLALGLNRLCGQRKLILTNQEKKLLVACLDFPGSLYDTMKTLQERGISYAELNHSDKPIPGEEKVLEIQKYEFERKTNEELSETGGVTVPKAVTKTVSKAIKDLNRSYDSMDFQNDLHLLWLNNESYVRNSPPERVARVLWLYQQGKNHGGLFLDLEETKDVPHHRESRLMFSVGNQPQTGFMTQVMEVFQRLKIGVRRLYSLNISTGIHPYFLGTFYILGNDGELVKKSSDLFRNLKTELYNTQILSPVSVSYGDFVTRSIMTGEEASLTNAFIAFCHTTLAHNQPDRYDLEVVKTAFHSNVEITLKLLEVFKNRFDPDIKNKHETYEKSVQKAKDAVYRYNTGQRTLDEIRKRIFRTCLSFIIYTLKTNFFVPEKHSLAFRLDPAYLSELGSEFMSDVPQVTPFRITFLFGRYGIGYHIGFSDIARGGWRTIVCENEDQHLTNMETLFREVFVLAHTQHLKNKDIYEGGSKMAVVLDATEADSQEAVTQRIYKLQYGFINAFLDIFVTEGGKAKNPRVIDYYGEDEAIELGPDENMHDTMIELIARLGVERGYILGHGIISSKRIGINHKEYGVTSRGVMKFSEIALKEHGIDIHRDVFTVKITGGTNGDVAGNAMRLLLECCPKAKITSIAAGAGALYDPKGVDRRELKRILLKGDVVDFGSKALHPGGFILFRRERQKKGLRDLHKKIIRTGSGVEEQWISSDEFHRQFDDLIFSVPADLFLPCGGRPETIDSSNWHRFFADDGTASARIIVEGANSYITPDARTRLQEKGVVVLRDASANKCGVISSSYEIIANLLMTEKEFLTHKESYVADVLSILDRRAEDEANLIFKRYRECEGRLLYTEIGNGISEEINAHYAKLFVFFRDRPELVKQPIFHKALLNHLPTLIRETPKFRIRIKKLPPKIRYAILASEISTRIVYGGGWEVDLEHRLKEYLKKELA